MPAEDSLSAHVITRHYIRCEVRSPACDGQAFLDERRFESKEAAGEQFESDGWTVKDELVACPKCKG